MTHFAGFDTVNHSQLLEIMLYTAAVREMAHQLFADCLTNRNTEELNVNCGVPQGTILCALLFSLNVGDVLLLNINS